MSKNLKTQWRVQARTSRAHQWVNRGLWETRAAARVSARALRSKTIVWDTWNEPKRVIGGYGFGNTRVIKYVKGQK